MVTGRNDRTLRCELRSVREALEGPALGGLPLQVFPGGVFTIHPLEPSDVVTTGRVGVCLPSHGAGGRIFSIVVLSELSRRPA